MASLALNRKKLLSVMIDAVGRASHLSLKVFNKLRIEQTQIKSDHSPVTVVDYGAQALVHHLLHLSEPALPMVGEEDTQFLRSSEGAHLADDVLQLVNQHLDSSISLEQMFTAIDHGSYEGGKSTFFTLDPIDGTKGFLRSGQYAICLALILDGDVELAVMGCPNLEINGHSGQLFVAERGNGAYQMKLPEAIGSPLGSASDVEPLATATKLVLPSEIDFDSVKFCESVEAGHSSHHQHSQIAELLNVKSEPIRMDSQCKYGMIATNQAQIYLRLPVSADYEEKIWDHASGDLLVREAGGIVTDIHGNRLDFTQGRTLKANKGVIASHAKVHSKLIESVKIVLANKTKNFF